RPAQDFEFRRQREYGQAHGEQHDEPDRIEQPVERSGREHARRWHATRTCHEHYARGIASVRYENVVEAGASEGGTHAERQRRRSNGAQQNPPSHATSDQREEVHGERGEQQRTRSRYHGMPRLTPVDFPRKEDQQNDDRGRQREANPPANPTSIHRGNVANVKPRSCSPLTIRGIACAVWVRSPTASYPSPSWRSKMYPARAPWTVLATMASVPGRSVSHTPSDHPTVRSPSERAIAVTHGLRNPWGARKNAGVTPDAPSIAALPRPRSSRTYAIPESAASGDSSRGCRSGVPRRQRGARSPANARRVCPGRRTWRSPPPCRVRRGSGASHTDWVRHRRSARRHCRRLEARAGRCRRQGCFCRMPRTQPCPPRRPRRLRVGSCRR